MPVHEEFKNHVASGLGATNYAIDLLNDGTYQAASGIVAVAATLDTSLTGTNNDLTYTAVTAGTAGNGITIAYVDPAAINQSISVSVSTLAISVSLATNGAGAITSTAANVKTAIDASVPAAALVTVANKTGNDGTGVVTALTATNLAGGLALTGTSTALDNYKAQNVISSALVHEESRNSFLSLNRYVDNLNAMAIFDGTDVIASNTTQTSRQQYTEDDSLLPEDYHSARATR